MHGEKIEGVDAEALHIPADRVQQLSGNAPAAVRFLHMDGADIGGQVGAVMEIILDDAQPADDLSLLQRQIPLGDSPLPSQAVGNAVCISLLRNAPLGMKSGGRLGGQFSMFPEFDDFHM